MPPDLEKHRDNALSQFGEWTRHAHQSGASWVTLDTETTGLDDDSDIIEIGVVDAYGERLMDTCIHPGTLPGGDEQVGGHDVHGITCEELAEAPTWGEIAPRLRNVLQGRLVLVYNLNFDGPKLRNNLQRRDLGITALTAAQDWACVMEAYAQYRGQWSDYHGDWSWVKLSDACSHHDIVLDDVEAHRAAADAEATRRLIYAVTATTNGHAGECIQCGRSTEAALCRRCIKAEVNDTPQRHMPR